MGIIKIKRSFKGGIHPNELKEISENLPFETVSTPATISIPLSQHIGKPAKILVNKKDEVTAGQLLAEQDGFVSSPVHSSVSGIVKQIKSIPHPGGLPKESIIIETAESAEKSLLPKLNYDTVSSEEIIDRVREAGIVGQGGAAFPTYIKLSPPKEKKIDCIIINGAECEPYLTRDYRFMIEQPEELIGGLKLLMKALKIERAAIGIEDNKPVAQEILSKHLNPEDKIEVYSIKTKYPQGAEKMLIKTILDREVPPGKLPMDVGVVIQNVGTAIAVYEAVVKGQPLITAALTVSGGGIKKPKNLIVPVGMSIGNVLEYCGGINENAFKIIAGGPMMGVALYDLSAPVLKATSGILVLTKEEAVDSEVTACLKCGKCVEVCPLNLIPTRLVRYTQLERYEDAENSDILTCMECGTCTYSCPANIPLVQWLRLGKKKAASLQYERQSA